MRRRRASPRATPTRLGRGARPARARAVQPQQAGARRSRAAERAVKMNPKLADAYVIIGGVHQDDGDARGGAARLPALPRARAEGPVRRRPARDRRPAARPSCDRRDAGSAELTMLVLGVETSCDETGRRRRRGRAARARRRRRLADRDARALRRRRARGRLAPARRDHRAGDRSGASPRRASRFADLDAHRGHLRARAWSARCWSASRPPRRSRSRSASRSSA